MFRSTTQNSGNGPQPIQYAELLAWEMLMGKKLGVCTVNWIMRMDKHYINSVAELKK